LPQIPSRRVIKAVLSIGDLPLGMRIVPYITKHVDARGRSIRVETAVSEEGDGAGNGSWNTRPLEIRESASSLRK
jgi:hypothetical protein